MTVGRIARKIFGKYFYIPGNIYRSVFVDLRKVARSVSPHIPREAVIVDVGGGDGELLNHLLNLRNDIKIKVIDTSADIGKAVRKEYSGRIELYPATGMGEFSAETGHQPDVILISDVVHHIPKRAREEFFSELRTLAGGGKRVIIIIKDVEPGFFRSRLGLMADRYISGDRMVSLISRSELCCMMAEAFENTLTTEETILFELDRPNYALVFVQNQL
jgi:SAM-dependent methyltransferase